MESYFHIVRPHAYGSAASVAPTALSCAAEYEVLSMLPSRTLMLRRRPSPARRADAVWSPSQVMTSPFLSRYCEKAKSSDVYGAPGSMSSAGEPAPVGIVGQIDLL